MFATLRTLGVLGLFSLVAAGCSSAPEAGDDGEGAALTERSSCIPGEPTRDPNELAPGPVALKSHYVDLDGVCTHYVEAGDANAPLIVLLHGIPEFWYSWREVIGPLVQAGYRVVAPDQRGVNESERPDTRKLENYKVKTLAKDVDRLIAHLLPGTEADGSPRKAIVVGHDFGAVTAYGVGMYAPDHVKKLVALDGPHPALWRKFLLDARDNEQFAMSWYVFAFASASAIVDPYFRGKIFGLGGGIRGQVEHFIKGDELTGVKDKSSISDADIDNYTRCFTDHREDLKPIYAHYEALFEEGEALYTNRSPLYLAGVSGSAYFSHKMLGISTPEFIAGREKFDPPQFPTIKVPMFVAYGSDDGFVKASLYADPANLSPYIANVKTKIFPNTSHWLVEEKPREVTDLIVSFARE